MLMLCIFVICSSKTENYHSLITLYGAKYHAKHFVFMN